MGITHVRGFFHGERKLKIKTKALVVSIHDVAPRTRATVDQMLKRLNDLGIRQCSLLVIPDYHHDGRFDRDAAFCDWLRDRVGEGHEAVLHGYYHLREGGHREGWAKRFWTQHYTAGEGEFFDLSRSEAARRLELGRQVFSAAGLDPSGFIAPAWLLGPEAEAAVRDAGFSYTVRIGGVTDLKHGCHHASRSLVYSVRAPWRRIASLGWNSLLDRSLRKGAFIRMSLHPPDFQYRSIWKHAEGCMIRALAGREAFTYERFVCAEKP